MSTAAIAAPEKAKAPEYNLIFVRASKILIVLALIVLLYARVTADLVVDWWNEPNLSYGLLIPPFAAWVAWMRRNITMSHPARPDNRGLALVASACLLFLVGEFGAEFFLARVSLWLLGTGLLWTFWGAARLRTLGFPLLLLATGIPLPVIVYNTVAAPLQLFASDVATGIAQGVGVTVYRDGNIIHLAHISLGVQEACSGLNSLSALMVASVLLGFLICRSPAARWILFFTSFPLSIAINVLRVAGTAIIADYDRQYALGFYHSFSGWLVFLVSFATLYGVARLLGWGSKRPETRQERFA